MSGRRGWPLLVLGLTSLCVLGGCAGVNTIDAADLTTTGEAPVPPGTPGEYRLRVGDDLEVRFISGQRYNYETIVTAAGTVTVPSGGEVVAVGKTVAELQDQIADAMSGLLLEPTPMVTLRRSSEQAVYVIGEVAGPGRVKTVLDMTLSMALAATGGIRSSGKPSSVMVVRTYGVPEPIAIKADMTKVFSGEDLSQDIPLAPNDVVYVPKSVIGKVNEFVDLFFHQIAPAQLFYLRGYDIMNLKGAEWRY